MNSPHRKFPWLRLAGTLLAAGLLVFWLAQNWTEVADALGQVGWAGLGLAFLLTLASRLSTVGRWHTLLRSGGAAVSPRQSIELTFAGLFAANFLPTTVGGDLVRFAGAARLGLDTVVVAASLVADRLVGMAGMATVLPLGLYQLARLPLAGQAQGLPLQGSMRGWGWLQRLSLLLAVGINADSGPGALRRAVKWVWGKLGELWDSLRRALRLWLTHPWALFQAYLFTWGHMLGVFLSVWLLFERMGETIPLWLVAGCWSMSYFPTLLPVSINGLGVQELTLTFFFTNYGGVSLPAALAMATLIRLLQAMASLPGALFVPGLIAGRKDPDRGGA